MPDLVKLCKAQTPHWPDGKAVTLVVRDPGSSDMRMVLEKVYGMYGTGGERADCHAQTMGEQVIRPLLSPTSDDELGSQSGIYARGGGVGRRIRHQ